MMPEFLNYAPGVRTYAEKNDVDSAAFICKYIDGYGYESLSTLAIS